MTPIFADVVLVTHLVFVLFIVGGLPAIWIGAARSWHWVRNFKLRVAHLAAISFVALEALLDMACPLTLWEDALRGAATETGFVARWLRRLLYYSLPDWVFTSAYVLFALLVAVTWWRVPPRHSQSD